MPKKKNGRTPAKESGRSEDERHVSATARAGQPKMSPRVRHQLAEIRRSDEFSRANRQTWRNRGRK